MTSVESLKVAAAGPKVNDAIARLESLSESSPRISCENFGIIAMAIASLLGGDPESALKRLERLNHAAHRLTDKQLAIVSLAVSEIRESVPKISDAEASELLAKVENVKRLAAELLPAIHDLRGKNSPATLVSILGEASGPVAQLRGYLRVVQADTLGLIDRRFERHWVCPQCGRPREESLPSAREECPHHQKACQPGGSIPVVPRPSRKASRSKGGAQS